MTTPDDKNNSLLDNLREPFQAWVTAGSRLGDVVTDFADRFKQDRENADLDAGAHAEHSPVDDAESSVGRFKAASQEAREGLSAASSTEDYKKVTATFAGRAEEILRDVAASTRRVAEETKDSAAVTDAKAAFGTAVASVKESFDDAVAQARSRRDASADEESILDDLRSRLDDLIGRAKTAAPEAPAEPAESAEEKAPPMIDGEVIDTPTDHKDV
ncbi:hypothetical protein HCH15_06670 [Corynebacterium testudinoris]|uniref:CGLAU_01105 family protein n=1 Tax=Corynebacterium testudinoris TaxID=136857 RepID=UPI001C8B61AB|nr:CGLAU_01105 family protein [Corynebacterium testudinoris]MBX8995864.1 hypothetical protein [Corynebacterium testudinoris]